MTAADTTRQQGEAMDRLVAETSPTVIRLRTRKDGMQTCLVEGYLAQEGRCYSGGKPVVFYPAEHGKPESKSVGGWDCDDWFFFQRYYWVNCGSVFYRTTDSIEWSLDDWDMLYGGKLPWQEHFIRVWIELPRVESPSLAEEIKTITAKR